MSYQEGITKDQTVATTLDLPNAVHDLVATLAMDERFRTFSRMIAATALAEIWKGSNWTTLLVPTDEAFGRLPEDRRSRLEAGREPSQIQRFLEGHALRGYFKEADLRAARNVKTLGGVPVEVTQGEGQIRLNGVRLTAADIACNNGIIHALDGVLSAE